MDNVPQKVRPVMQHLGTEYGVEVFALNERDVVSLVDDRCIEDFPETRVLDVLGFVTKDTAQLLGYLFLPDKDLAAMFSKDVALYVREARSGAFRSVLFHSVLLLTALRRIIRSLEQWTLLFLYPPIQ